MQRMEISRVKNRKIGVENKKTGVENRRIEYATV
jgi:hypothetical protein